jgi:protein-tyrosine phosphatase
VAEYLFVGYPCPPMLNILMIVKSIIEWLANDKNHIALIHCQSTKGRSAIIIACLLTVLKQVNHPMEALTYFCNVKNLSSLTNTRNSN